MPHGRLEMEKVPVQLFEDYQNHRPSTALGEVELISGEYTPGMRSIFPKKRSEIPLKKVLALKKIKGFDRPDAVLSGGESRTSSPSKNCS